MKAVLAAVALLSSGCYSVRIWEKRNHSQMNLYVCGWEKVNVDDRNDPMQCISFESWAANLPAAMGKGPVQEVQR